MTAPRVVLISDVFRLDPTAVQRLGEAGFDPVPRYEAAHRPDELRRELVGAWGVVAGSERYSTELIDELTSVRVIARPGVGYDAIDLAAASRRGITVMITPGANDESVADHTLALMLAVCRRVVENDEAIRHGEWRIAPIGRDLAGAKVGIVGLGAIGRAVARRLSGFGCQLRAAEVAPDLEFCRQHHIELAPITELAGQVDIVTVHLPLLRSTVGFVSREILRSLPNGALVINTSRGSVIEEGALVDGLRSGRLGGAGLDVYADEPLPRDHPFRTLPNTVLTPHVAALTTESVRRMADATIANLVAYRDGEIPAGSVNTPARMDPLGNGTTNHKAAVAETRS